MSLNKFKEIKDVRNIDEIKGSKIGVIGICGVNGNLIARIFADNGFDVCGTDLQNKKDCTYMSSLKSYPEIKLYHGNTPEEFYENCDYIIIPDALTNDKNKPTKKIEELMQKYNFYSITVDNVYDLFSPVHPVICTTGTNGKTTSTTLLKHIAYQVNKKPNEHNLKDLQGNFDDIPALQSRLGGDISILETSTNGDEGKLGIIAKNSEPDCVIITNITPDHLDGGLDFLDYARRKAEIIEEVRGKTLVANMDDPTVMGLLKEMEYDGNLITFGLNEKHTTKDTKKCFCGKDIEMDSFIYGVGNYKCSCGLENKNPTYLIEDVNDAHTEFSLKTPYDGNQEFELSISGLHNIYNATGVIIAAHEELKISFEDIKIALKTFTGVAGRMDYIGRSNNKDIMIDYAHNPAGIKTVLKELKNKYDTIINVITTTSESGIDGDIEIMDNACLYADYIVPASHNTYECAKHLLEKGKYIDKIVLPDTMPKYYKNSFTGASKEQVLIGFNKALDIDADLLVCTGEAAFKHKNTLIEEINE